MKKRLFRLSVFLVLAVCLTLCATTAASADSKLTDEELYQIIDQQLESDNRYEGRLVVAFAYKLPYEQAVAALEAAGITDSADGDVFYTYLKNRSGNTQYFRITAEEQQLRELALKLWRIEEIETVAVDYFEEEPDRPVVSGDIDGNGKTDAKDYMMLKRAVLGTYTVESADAADIDGNGEINAKDYMMLKRMVLGTFSSVE